MASPLSKRLEKIEQLLADRINKPIGTIWINAGETKEQAAVRCGYTVDQVPQLMSIRWLDPARGETPKPIQHPLDPIVEAGPPDDVSEGKQAETATPSVTQMSPHPEGSTSPDMTISTCAPKQMDLEEMIAAKERYEAAIAERQREIVQEKLQAATKAFAKSIA